MTTLIEMVKTQKLDNDREFLHQGNGATAKLMIANPSAAIDTNAGENSPKYDWESPPLFAQAEIFFVVPLHRLHRVRREHGQ